MRPVTINTVWTVLGCGALLALGACGTTARYSTSPGAVRGQEVQPGQDQSEKMTREQAEEIVNTGNANQVGSNTQVEGKPDEDAEQGKLPPGVGYANNPGILYDPAMGQQSYTVHHYVHHIQHDGSSESAEALSNAPPPSGYRAGHYVVPDNENPNARSWGGYSGYDMGTRHVYSAGANVTNHHYGGSGGPGGNYGASGERSFGRWHPNAFDGAGRINGFTD